MKIETAVKRETCYIAVFTLILSCLMEAVYLIAGFWDYTVILGNLLGAGGSVLNFFLMGLTIQKAVQEEEKQAKTRMRLSHTLRMLVLFAVALIGVLLPCFQTWAVLIPLFFPRIAIQLSPLVNRKRENAED